MLVIFWPLVTMAEDNINVSVDVKQGQSQLQPGGKSGGKVDTRIRSFINPYMDTEFLLPPATYPPGKPTVYKEEDIIPFWKLDNIPLMDLIEKYKEEGNIIQYEKKLIFLGNNKRDVHLLPYKLKETAIWSVCLDSPSNGFIRETIRRAVSLAKVGTGTDRVFIQVEKLLNPRNAGNALSWGGASSFLPGTSALAFGAQPQIGKSESRVYPLYRVIVYCYRPGPIPTKDIQPRPKILFFKGEKLTNQGALNYNAAWLAERFDQIKKRNFRVKILGQGQKTEEITKIAVYTLGNALINRGLPTKDVTRILEGIPVSTAVPRLKPPIQGVTGVVWLKISK